jgi:hypothetical protein
MTGRLLRLLAALAACLISLAAANVTALAAAKDTKSAAAAAQAQPDPGNMTGMRGQDNQQFVFTVTGATDGTIYGEGTYTDDSPLATAAVHAGMLNPGDTKDLTVEVLPGKQNYKAAFDFGIQSNSYGAWQGSYKFIGTPMAESDAVFPDPGNLTLFRGKIGKILKFSVTGATDQSVWGDGIYTDDSDLDTAAVQAGLINDGDTATVAVKFLPGQGKYIGKTRNGVNSQSFGKWDSSYEFVDDSGNPIKPKG